MKKKSLFNKIISLGVAGVGYLIYTFVSPSGAPQETTTQKAPVQRSPQVSKPSQPRTTVAKTSQSSSRSRYDQTNDRIAKAFRNHESDLMVESAGRVIKVLRDDTEGIPHQRFLLRLNNDVTILIAHNTSLASRIPNLSEGDTVTFKGEYEWNNKGGVVHWTHHDPRGRHEGGWLEHSGKRYE